MARPAVTRKGRFLTDINDIIDRAVDNKVYTPTVERWIRPAVWEDSGGWRRGDGYFGVCIATSLISRLRGRRATDGCPCCEVGPAGL